MEFIGKEGIRAPIIKETVLKNPKRIFKLILTNLKRLYNDAGLVHADLSEYNIMIWKNRPVIFDFAQSVLVNHPMSDRFLRRDLENLHRYFNKEVPNIISLDQIYERITSGRN
jgi:RIO kinase 1